MSTDLGGRTAIVTGAGGGIGRATALQLARLGAAVVVNDLGTALDGRGSDASRAEAVAEEIRAAGGRAVANADSVADFDAAGRIVASALENFGSADILVNNAGLTGPQAGVWDIGPDTFERVTASHIKGSYNCAHHACPHMRDKGWGRVVNLVSRAGIVGMQGSLAYGTGKGGVFGFTNVLSRDLVDCGITVNAVNPASTETRMVTGLLENVEGDERRRNLQAVMQRPEQVAVLIASLCTPAAAGVTGQVFFVHKNQVGLFQPLAVTQATEREEDWSVADLAAALGEFDLHPLHDPYK